MECLPCFSGCTDGFGCGGPLKILNSTNGCIHCNTIILKRNGEQVSTMLLVLLLSVMKSFSCHDIKFYNSFTCLLKLKVKYTVLCVYVIISFRIIVSVIQHVHQDIIS